MTNRRFVALLGVVMLSASAGCDESLQSIAGPTPNLTATFSSIRRDLFQNGDERGRTACVTCHNNAAVLTGGGLNLLVDPYDALVNARGIGKQDAILVIPGDPENSYLVHKVEGRPGIAGDRMPQDGPPFLTDGQVQLIRRWIELGARND